MKRHLLIFIALVALSARSSGQATLNLNHTSYPMTDPIPKTPEAAAFEKSGNVPVSLTTGVPNITIPIYNLKMRDLSIPISMSYNSSGIRVEELATSTGLGWNLQAGGAVTDAVYGLPDFGTDGWLHSSYKTPQTFPYKTTFGDDFLTDTTYFFYTLFLKETIDTQPDVFTANFLGRSIKFYFDQNNNLYLMPYQRVKLIPSTTSSSIGINGYTLIDEHDNKFLFFAEEMATTTADNPSGYTDLKFIHVTYVPTFYLSQVITASGDTATFNYDTKRYTVTNQRTETRYSDPTPLGTKLVVSLPPELFLHSHTDYNSLRLSSIVTSLGDTVKFNYGFNRLDLPSLQALTNISVIHKSTNLTSYNLSYDHFYDNRSLPDSDDYRLRLLSVQQTGKPPYQFSYNTTNLLPNRLSFAQDHWGYYNGHNTNSTFCPIDSANYFYTGANRNPNGTYAQAGLLTEIIYPTGGKTDFTYEPNTYYSTQILNTPNTLRVTANSEHNAVNSVNFTVPSGAHDIQVSYQTLAPAGYSTLETTPTTTIQIKQGNTLIHQYSGANSFESTTLSGGNTYTIKVCPEPNGNTVFMDVYWRLSTESATDTVTGNFISGGNRVRQITDYAGGTTVPQKTYYQYTQEGDSTKSSSVIRPLFQYVSTYNVLDEDTIIPLRKMYAFNVQYASSQIPLNSFQGINSYYNFVTVYKGDKSAGGYTTSKFMNPSGSGGYGYPFAPVISYDWLMGILLERKEYRYNAPTSSYTIVQKEDNTYRTIFGPSVSGLPHENEVIGIKVGVVIPAVLANIQYGFDYPIDPSFTVDSYNLISTWFHPISKIETNYNPVDSTKKIVTMHNYYYDNPNHIELTRETITRSDGRNYHTLMRYPLDVYGTYSYNSSPVIEKWIMTNDGTTSKVADASITTYLNQPGEFPETYSTFKNVTDPDSASIGFYNGSVLNSNFEKRIDYSYDSHNNLVSITKDNVLPTGYHWGYDHRYPVAQCLNAQSNEFYFEGFEESIASGVVAGASHTGKYYSTNNSVSWTLPNSRHYVIDYWYHSSGVWHFKQDVFTGTYSMMSGADGYDDIRIYPADAQITSYTY